jgi:ParB-like chromosome segregation protein Spo0J
MAKHPTSGSKVPPTLAEPKLIRLKVSEILPFKENPRSHGAEQLRLLRKSMEHYGLVSLPVVQAGTRRLIAGHGRIDALRSAGFKDREIPVLEVEMNDQDALAYTVIDNRTVDLSAWKMPELKSAMAELDDGAFDMELTGFDADAISEMFPLEEGPVDLEKEPKPKDPQTQIRPGDMILLGEHCLHIGEATGVDDLDRVATWVGEWKAVGGSKPKVLRSGKEVSCGL